MNYLLTERKLLDKISSISLIKSIYLSVIILLLFYFDF